MRRQQAPSPFGWLTVGQPAASPLMAAASLLSAALQHSWFYLSAALPAQPFALFSPLTHSSPMHAYKQSLSSLSFCTSPHNLCCWETWPRYAHSLHAIHALADATI